MHLECQHRVGDGETAKVGDVRRRNWRISKPDDEALDQQLLDECRLTLFRASKRPPKNIGMMSVGHAPVIAVLVKEVKAGRRSDPESRHDNKSFRC